MKPYNSYITSNICIISAYILIMLSFVLNIQLRYSITTNSNNSSNNTINGVEDISISLVSNRYRYEFIVIDKHTFDSYRNTSMLNLNYTITTHSGRPDSKIGGLYINWTNEKLDFFFLYLTIRNRTYTYILDSNSLSVLSIYRINEHIFTSIYSSYNLPYTAGIIISLY